MKFLTFHPAANSFFVTTRSTTLAEVLGSSDKKEKEQKATQGVESKGIGLSFYSQAAEEISDT
jgi:hypothetical protein